MGVRKRKERKVRNSLKGAGTVNQNREKINRSCGG